VPVKYKTSRFMRLQTDWRGNGSGQRPAQFPSMKLDR